MSIYNSYTTPQNLTIQGAKQFIFPDSAEKGAKFGRTLQYRKQQGPRDSANTPMHDFEKERSTAFDSNQKEERTPFGSENKVLELREDVLNRIPEGGWGRIPEHLKTPSKGGYSSLTPKESLHAKTDRSQFRPLDEYTNRTTTVASPRDANRYLMFTPRRPEKKDFLSSTNRFLFEAFSPVKVRI